MLQTPELRTPRLKLKNSVLAVPETGITDLRILRNQQTQNTADCRVGGAAAALKGPRVLGYSGRARKGGEGDKIKEAASSDDTCAGSEISV